MTSSSFVKDVAQLRQVLERNNISKEDVGEDVLNALLEQHASDEQRIDFVLLDLQDLLGKELAVGHLGETQEERWKELQAPRFNQHTQDEVLVLKKSSRPTSLPCVIDLEQPSTSGQNINIINIVYASQLSSNKRKMSGTSDVNLPKKPANTYLIDREAECHQSGCNRQPSDCRCTFVSWIWAQLPDAVKSVRSGKWMLFPSKQNVNEIWKKVKILLAENQLGNGAKVANEESKFYLICLYTYDFQDVQDVFRVLVAIRRNRLSGGYLNYKTDEATSQGLYTTDQAAQSAGFGSAKKKHPGEKGSMYSSPPPLTNNPRGADKDFVQLFLNNIEPDYKKGLVAEIRADVGGGDLKEIFYNPPQIVQAVPPKKRTNPKSRKPLTDSS